jgi:hypothetical protein
LPDHHSIGVPSRAGDSDLYSFADSVIWCVDIPIASVFW